jgi:hypothetical protein
VAANDTYRALVGQLLGLNPDVLILAGTAAKGALVMGYLAIAASLTGLYYMTRCYRIKARPFWDHWQVATAFGGSMLSLGALLTGAVVTATLAFNGESFQTAALLSGIVLTIGLAIEGIGHIAHAKDMGAAEHEGGASYYIQSTTFGKTFLLRNALIGLNLLLAVGLLVSMVMQAEFGLLTMLAWGLVGVTLLTTSIIGRALFYVLVIPTTMPGAFFWKNKGFEEHARDIGLAEMPQVGVVPLRKCH